MKKEFLEGYRGFTVFLIGTLMCIALSLYAIYKGSPVSEVVSILYWWAVPTGFWMTRASVDKLGSKEKV